MEARNRTALRLWALQELTYSKKSRAGINRWFPLAESEFQHVLQQSLSHGPADVQSVFFR
jgi:hypothetical protein